MIVVLEQCNQNINQKTRKHRFTSYSPTEVRDTFSAACFNGGSDGGRRRFVSTPKTDLKDTSSYQASSCSHMQCCILNILNAKVMKIMLSMQRHLWRSICFWAWKAWSLARFVPQSDGQHAWTTGGWEHWNHCIAQYLFLWLSTVVTPQRHKKMQKLSNQHVLGWFGCTASGLQCLWCFGVGQRIY